MRSTLWCGRAPRVVRGKHTGSAALQKRGKSVSDGFSRASLCVLAVKPRWQFRGEAAKALQILALACVTHGTRLKELF